MLEKKTIRKTLIRKSSVKVNMYNYLLILDGNSSLKEDGRFYFSKPALQCSEEKIYSDRETKIVMCRKIIKRKLVQLIPLLVISVFISCVLALNMFHYRFFPLGIIFIVSLIWLGGLILTLYSTKYLAGFFKLKKIIEENMN